MAEAWSVDLCSPSFRTDVKRFERDCSGRRKGTRHHLSNVYFPAISALGVIQGQRNSAMARALEAST